jgi:FliI/YscN family ATPase
MFELVPEPTAPLRFVRAAQSRLREARLTTPVGSVVRVAGLVIESHGPKASLGDLCVIRGSGGRDIPVEVVGFNEQRLVLMPLEGLEGLSPGDEVRLSVQQRRVPLANRLTGRVIDALGRPMDDAGPVEFHTPTATDGGVPNPLRRARIRERLTTGVRALDAFIPLGQGQRVGIFAGSGVGKSTLLGMIARRSNADVNVVALIGERGREVREFLEGDLDAEGRARSIVVVSTAEKPALLRMKAAYLALSLAEQLRDEGKRVLLMMDSVTRFAMAQREVGLAVGEPPTARGYTPSVFAALPRLLERAGNSDRGSITGVFTVLVEGDDLTEPVADATRSILDGHVVLSRELADRNHWPAIEVLGSISRLNRDLLNEEQLALQAQVRDLLVVHRQNRDLISVGAYVAGTNPALDHALKVMPRLESFLRQSHRDVVDDTSLWTSLAEAIRIPQPMPSASPSSRSASVGSLRAAGGR